MKKTSSKNNGKAAAPEKTGTEHDQSDERFRSLVEMSPDAIGIHCEGKYVYINPAGARIFGAKGPEDIIGKSVLEFVPPEYHALVRERMQLSYERREMMPLRESKLICLDGSCLDVEVVTAPVMYHDKPATQMILRDISARKRAEETMRQALENAVEEKNKSEAIIAALADSVSIQDRDFRVLYQNQRHRDFIGGDHLGELCYKAYRNKDKMCESCPVARSFEDGKRHSEERTAVMERGEVNVEITSAPLRDASGEIIAAVEVVRDITDRKRAEKELRLFRTLIDQSNDLIFIADPETGRILDCNEIVSKKYGYTRREILAMNVTDFNVNIPDDSSWKQRVEDIIKRGSLMIENVHQRKNGTTFPVEVNVKPVVQEGRQYLLAVIRDISERRRMETEREDLIKELQVMVETVTRSRKEWRDTFDYIQDPIYITDANYSIVKANKAFADYSEQGFTDILGKKCHELLHESCSPYNLCPHRFLQDTGRPADVEIVDQRHKRTLVVSHFPYTTEGGGFGGAINIIRDVTEEREREMKFIMNERLASLGQMAASIAHEINNPLAAIMGCAEGLVHRLKQERFDPVLFKKYLEIIEEEIVRCQIISNSMLSYVRQGSLEKTSINVHETLDRTLEVIGFQGRLRGVKVVKHYLPAGNFANSNANELKQVFLAVIANALDAMDDKGTLSIETGGKGGDAFVAVSDTGGGIGAEQINRIFDPFFSTKAERGGTGLGLSITKKILADLNGDITVSSEVGKGTTFTITLPKPS